MSTVIPWQDDMQLFLIWQGTIKSRESVGTSTWNLGRVFEDVQHRCPGSAFVGRVIKTLIECGLQVDYRLSNLTMSGLKTDVGI
jgi:hypothetical protein